MANSPAHRWEDGRLVERAISTNAPGDPNEFEGTTAKPYKTPVLTPRSPEDREELKAILEAADGTENKQVKSKKATKK